MRIRAEIHHEYTVTLEVDTTGMDAEDADLAMDEAALSAVEAYERGARTGEVEDLALDIVDCYPQEAKT